MNPPKTRVGCWLEFFQRSVSRKSLKCPGKQSKAKPKTGVGWGWTLHLKSVKSPDGRVGKCYVRWGGGVEIFSLSSKYEVVGG